MAAPALWIDPSGAGETRWEDCVPGRTDLPRRLPEMPMIGISALAADAPRPAREGLCYRRTSRSGQGRLTARPTTGLVLVLISAQPSGDAQALRDWGDFVHLSHIAAAGVPGYTMITPYEVDGRGPRFLHLYELDGEDPERVFQSMTSLVRARLGDDEFTRWAWHPALSIDYVSTYRRVA
jgi:hypothetical protein